MFKNISPSKSENFKSCNHLYLLGFVLEPHPVSGLTLGSALRALLEVLWKPHTVLGTEVSWPGARQALHPPEYLQAFAMGSRFAIQLLDHTTLRPLNTYWVRDSQPFLTSVPFPGVKSGPEFRSRWGTCLACGCAGRLLLEHCQVTHEQRARNSLWACLNTAQPSPPATPEIHHLQADRNDPQMYLRLRPGSWGRRGEYCHYGEETWQLEKGEK